MCTYELLKSIEHHMNISVVSIVNASNEFF